MENQNQNSPKKQILARNLLLQKLSKEARVAGPSQRQVKADNLRPPRSIVASPSDKIMSPASRQLQQKFRPQLSKKFELPKTTSNANGIEKEQKPKSEGIKKKLF